MRDQDRIREHMEVVGTDGQHVGTVDHLDAGDTIKLARNDPEAGGRHHWIPGDWVSQVENDRVRLNMSCNEAQRRWQDQNPGNA